MERSFSQVLSDSAKELGVTEEELYNMVEDYVRNENEMRVERELEEAFEKECLEWLVPLDYSIHSFSADHKHYSFMSNKIGKNYPFVDCGIDGNTGNKYSEVISIVPQSIFKMSCGPLMFKHPDIEKFINKMKYYIDLINEYPYYRN